MDRKYMLGVLFIFVILLSLFVETHSGGEVTRINIFNLSTTFVGGDELNKIINQNQTSSKMSSDMEMELFENYTFEANKTIELSGNVAVVPVLYPPNIRFTSITVKNAELLNASILISGNDILLDLKNTSIRINRMSHILLLKLKIPKNEKAVVKLEYCGDIGNPGEDTPITSIFVRYKSRDEIEMLPAMFLPVLSTGVSEITLKLPQSWRNWTGVLVNDELNNPKVWVRRYGRLVFTSETPFKPFVIIGDFKRMAFRADSVNVTVYLPKRLPKNVSLKYRNVVGDIITTFSSWYMPYPYPDLTIVFSSNMVKMTGINRKGTILITANATPSLLAHEISHSWFGWYAYLGNIDESLATYSEMAYMIKFYKTHPEELEKYAKYNLTTIPKVLDFVEEQILKYNHDYPEPLSQVYRTWIQNSSVRNAIMYDKGAFVFRSLQFVLGNRTFFDGLRGLLKECQGRECNLTDIQEVFENVSGRNLDWFFKEWFYTAKVPDYEVENLGLDEESGKYILSFEITDKNNFTMPLEVEVITAGQKILKKVWINQTARVEFELKDKPTRIILDPNEWMINENKEFTVDGIKIIVG